MHAGFDAATRYNICGNIGSFIYNIQTVCKDIRLIRQKKLIYI